MILNIFKKILRKIGVDGAIFYTSLARIIQASTGIITIFFVARFLSGVEQGFYYTFGSILSIQVFFELGLNGIITQYVAHEISYLEWESDNKLTGSTPNLSRLSSLLHFGVKWYSIIGGILFLILILTGFVFFRRFDTSGGTVDWFIPWVILSASTTIAFLVNPLLAFIEGMGKIKQVAKLRLIKQVITTLMIWITLFSGANLYSSGISNVIGLLIIIVFIFFSEYKGLILNVWKVLGLERVSYKNEILPYQWKIALSWISGYFIFQLFNPVLFATDGAIVAGQMGMTLAAINGVFSLSFSWMTTKVPLYSGLIAQKKYVELDNIFNLTLKQSVAINGLGLAVLFILVYGLKYLNIPLGTRFLPYLPLAFMMIPIFLNQFVSSWAIYLRCHKEEPFLLNSVVGGILCLVSTIMLGKHYGLIGVTTGYFSIVLLMFPWAYYIYKTKKIEWHKGVIQL